MSLGPAKAETAVPSPDNPPLLARLKGIITRPRPTFAAVVMRPQAAGALALLTLISFAATAAFLATEVGQVALVDQWERTALAYGQTVNDARYAEMQRLSRYGVPYAAASAAVRGPVASIGLAAVLYGVFRARGRRATFVQVLAVVAHAGVILTVRDAVAAPLNYMQESLSSPLTLISMAGVLDEGSPVARFLSLLDVFVLWWLLVLAVGLAVLYHARARFVALALLGSYVGIALLVAAAMAVLGGNG